MDVKEKYKNTDSILLIAKIAVTGSAGSGKSTVCKRLKELGAETISSDALAREAVALNSPAYEKIVKYFGEGVLEKDGALNRQELRRIITNDVEARKAIESFLHPEILRLMKLKMEEAEKRGEPLIVVEVPLLFELGLQDMFDIVIVVSVNREILAKRIMRRDKVSIDEAEALLDIQMPDEQKIKRADVVIENKGSMEEMIKSVDLFYRKLLKKNTKSIESA